LESHYQANLLNRIKMNIYHCWYQGASGFAGKQGKNLWLFVPDLAQLDGRVKRNIRLNELIFKNRLDFQYELGLQTDGSFSLLRRIGAWLFPTEHAHTTAGMLLLPQNK